MLLTKYVHENSLCPNYYEQNSEVDNCMQIALLLHPCNTPLQQSDVKTRLTYYFYVVKRFTVQIVTKYHTM